MNSAQSPSTARREHCPAYRLWAESADRLVGGLLSFAPAMLRRVQGGLLVGDATIDESGDPHPYSPDLSSSDATA